MMSHCTQRAHQMRRAFFAGLACALPLIACSPTLNATQVRLRNCVEQEGAAEGRMACLRGVESPAGEPATCSERRTYGSETAYLPLDDKRLEGLRKDAKYRRHEAWKAINDAPFTYYVAWKAPVEVESRNASEWLRGSLLGYDANLALTVGPLTRKLVDMSVQSNGALIADFVDYASSESIREAVDGLTSVLTELQQLGRSVHDLFTGLYLGLDKLNATTACYRDVAEAERRMQAAIGAFTKTITASRDALENRHNARAREEAALLEKDRKAWSEAKAEQCRAPKAATDCDGIDAYLSLFPSGEHAQEAKQILTTSAPVLTPLRDEAAWTSANLAACRTPESSRACDGVQAYIQAHPQGQHADEAKRMLRLRRSALAQLAAVEDQRRRMAVLRAKQKCVEACAADLRACQKSCRDGAAEALGECHKSCLITFRKTCSPACDK